MYNECVPTHHIYEWLAMHAFCAETTVSFPHLSFNEVTLLLAEKLDNVRSCWLDALCSPVDAQLTLSTILGNQTSLGVTLSRWTPLISQFPFHAVN